MRLLSPAALGAALLVVSASPAFATPPPGVDMVMSTVLQENQSSISGLAIRGRLHSPQLLDNVTIMPTLEWWRSSNHVEPYGIEIRTVRGMGYLMEKGIENGSADAA